MKISVREQYIDTFIFNSDWQIIQKKLKKISDRAKYCDELERAILQCDFELAKKKEANLTHVRPENLQKVFAACKLIKIPRIFIGKRELVGADDIRDGSFPAIWTLSDLLGGPSFADSNTYGGGCGNGDQSQIQDSDSFLPDGCLDKAFDVETQTEIDLQPFKKRMVVSRHLKGNPK